MFTTRSIPRSFVAVMLIALMAGGTALAQRGDRGGGRGGDGGGGRGGGGGPSMSRSGGGGGGPSFSRGGGGPSFSRGGDRGGPSISRGGGESRSFGGPSIRSGGDRGGPSFSRGSSRSFSDGGRSIGRSIDRGPSSFRSGGERPSISRSLGDSDRGRPSFDRGSGQGLGRQQYEARRPTESQVRDFLGRDGGDRSFRRDGQDIQRRDLSRSRQDFRRDTEGVRDRAGERSLSERIGDSRDRQALRDRIGDRDLSDRIGDRGDREELRDRLGDRDGLRDRLGDRDDLRDRFGDRDDDRDFDRGDRDRFAGDRDRFRDRDGRDRDERDWSGRWRDRDRFADSVRDRWHDRWRDHDDWDDFPFYGRWWVGYGHPWGFWGGYHRNPWYWWTWVTAPRLASWVHYGWPTYYYWDYGPGEYLYYDNGAIYVNGQWYQPAPVYYERTVQLIEEAPLPAPEEAANLEWLPLGVFAVTLEGRTDADMLVQLAVTREGIIGGTAFNQTNDDAYPIEGTVEEETQRAVWSYNDARGRRILMESSIYNLTQPEATGLVHYGPNDMRVVNLVRLEAPEDANVAGADSRTTR